jgi:hypothetical protein
MKYEGLFTNEATEVTTKTAVLNASFTSKNSLVKSKGFEYKTKDSGEYIRLTVEDELFSAELQNLPSATYYIFRAFVTTDKETLYGREIEFRTQLEACGPNCGHQHLHNSEDNHDGHRIVK